MIAVLDPSPLRLSRLYDRPRRPFRLTPEMAIAVGMVAAVQFAIGFSIAHTYFASPAQDQPAEPNIVTFVDRMFPPKPVAPPLPGKTAPRPQPVAFTPATHDVLTPTAPVDDALPVTPHTDGEVDTAVTPFVQPDRGPVSPSVASRDPVIGNPNWISRPTAQQVGRLYPVRAAESGIAGKATLLCEVLASGAVGSCAVTEETPKGQHFGDAALAMTRYFKLSPRTVDGVSVAGSKVRIPIVFNLG